MISHRVEIADTQILQLLLDSSDTEAVSDGRKISMFSSALSLRFCSGIHSIVLILCSRSASFIIITLMSFDMAMSIFLTFSAC